MEYETIKTLCSLSGPSSFEGPVREYLRQRAEAVGAEVRIDGMGNLICTKKGKIPAPRKLMLTAHLDEVGLIIRRITEDGYLKFDCLGEIDYRVLIGKPVFIGKNRFPGVVGLKAVHLTTAEERKKTPKLESLYIDIGVKSREEAEKLTYIGDFAVFSDSITEYGDGLLKAKAIDGRSGCAIMASLMERDLPIDVTFAFTVQEEVGCRGAFGAAFSETPALALVLDGTDAGDLPMVEAHKRACSLGKGTVLSHMDAGTIYDKEIFELLQDLAEENHIPWQVKGYISEKTDASAIQRSKTGVRAGRISIAVRYLHSPSSVVSLRDIEGAEALVVHFIQAVAEGRIS